MPNVESNAFKGCDSIRSVEFAEGWDNIAESMFYACNNLQTVIMPEGINTINIAAFGNCKSLRQIVLPSTLRNIKERAFESAGLNDVVSLAVVPPTLYSSTCFPYSNSNFTVRVPAVTLDEYKSASVWKTFASKIVAIETEN